jgi:hypothetical protein
MEVNPANPRSDTNAQEKSDYGASRAQGRSF